MTKMENFYMPPAAPANITDIATRTRRLDKEGLMSLRQADDLPPEILPWWKSIDDTSTRHLRGGQMILQHLQQVQV